MKVNLDTKSKEFWNDIGAIMKVPHPRNKYAHIIWLSNRKSKK